MMRHTTPALLVFLLVAAVGPAAEPDPAVAVDAVLTAFHTAASEADGELYFSLLADDAVYIGTDASERWTVAEFRAFAEPYFSAGHGWTYTATSRHIVIGPDGATAWFDELLSNQAYGATRGTGVLVRTDDGWRIAQYHLTIPVPNELARQVVAMIEQLENRDGD
jgi:uncharacterized protein (TIGR02246 family)